MSGNSNQCSELESSRITKTIRGTAISQKDTIHFKHELEKINLLLAEFSDPSREISNFDASPDSKNIDTRHREFNKPRVTRPSGSILPNAGYGDVREQGYRDRSILPPPKRTSVASYYPDKNPSGMKECEIPKCPENIRIREISELDTMPAQQKKKDVSREIGADEIIDIASIERKRECWRRDIGSPLRSSFKKKLDTNPDGNMERDRRVRFDAEGTETSPSKRSLSSYMGKAVKAVAKSVVCNISRFINLKNLVRTKRVRQIESK